MPLVTIKLFEGRTPDQLRGLVKDVTDAVSKNTGAPSDDVVIDIVEMRRDRFSKGGKLASD